MAASIKDTFEISYQYSDIDTGMTLPIVLKGSFTARSFDEAKASDPAALEALKNLLREKFSDTFAAFSGKTSFAGVTPEIFKYSWPMLMLDFQKLGFTVSGDVESIEISDASVKADYEAKKTALEEARKQTQTTIRFAIPGGHPFHDAQSNQDMTINVYATFEVELSDPTMPKSAEDFEQIKQKLVAKAKEIIDYQSGKISFEALNQPVNKNMLFGSLGGELFNAGYKVNKFTGEFKEIANNGAAAPAAQAAPAAPSAPAVKRFCTNCGQPNTNGSKFCPNCGNSLI